MNIKSSLSQVISSLKQHFYLLNPLMGLHLITLIGIEG